MRAKYTFTDPENNIFKALAESASLRILVNLLFIAMDAKRYILKKRRFRIQLCYSFSSNHSVEVFVARIATKSVVCNLEKTTVTYGLASDIRSSYLTHGCRGFTTCRSLQSLHGDLHDEQIRRANIV